MSSTKQVDNLLNGQPTEQRSSVKIANVPFINQDVGQCGPATLTMAAQWAGKIVPVEQVTSIVYTPGMKGSLQTDMVTGARRLGLVAVPIEGFSELLAEIKSGNPVIVFENLALSWLPQWHYAIVFGYDLQNETVLMHSGPEENKVWDIRKFERSWKLGDYWGLVVLPPEKLSATGSEISHLAASAGLEQLGQTEQALAGYRSMLVRWPSSLGALIGIGNYQFQQKNYAAAAKTLRQATENHSESAAAWHNLAVAQYSAQMKKAARLSAEKALQFVSNDLRPQYENSLRAILKVSSNMD